MDQTENSIMSKTLYDQVMICPSNSKKDTAKKETKARGRPPKQFYTVEKILDKEGKGANAKFLVKWEGYNEGESTWEPLTNLKACRTLIDEFYARRKKLSEASLVTIPQAPPEKKQSSSKIKISGTSIIDLLNKSKKPEPVSVTTTQLLSNHLATVNAEQQGFQPRGTKSNSGNQILEIENPLKRKPVFPVETNFPKKLKRITTTEVNQTIDTDEIDICGIDIGDTDQRIDLVDVIDIKGQRIKNIPADTYQSKGEGQKKVVSTTMTKPQLIVDLKDTQQSKKFNQSLIEKATKIIEHAHFNGNLYFKLAWDEINASDDIRSKFFTYEAIDHLKPRLLTAYLREFIKLG